VDGVGGALYTAKKDFSRAVNRLGDYYGLPHWVWKIARLVQLSSCWRQVLPPATLSLTRKKYIWPVPAAAFGDRLRGPTQEKQAAIFFLEQFRCHLQIESRIWS